MSQIHGYHPYQQYPPPSQSQSSAPHQNQQYYANNVQQPNPYGSYQPPHAVGTNGYASLPPQGYNVAMNGYMPSASASSGDEGRVKAAKVKTAATGGGGVGKWTGSASTSSPAAALPPVKNACISCRTRKARCDGRQPICGQCASRDRECVFVKSRRGGKRIRKAAVDAVEATPTPNALSTFLQKLDGLLLPPAQGWTATAQDNADDPDVKDPAIDRTKILRNIESLDLRQLLTLHYDEVHGFLPVLPHRRHFEQVLAYLPAQSSLLFAIKAILLLVPNEADPAPNSKVSKKVRALASSAAAKQSYDLIDSLSAAIEQGDEYDEATAAKLKLDMVQALVVLCLWEWGQTADLVRNKAAANRAIQYAMDLGLHQLDKGKHHSSGSRSQSPASAGRRGSMHSNASSWEMPLVNGRSLEGADWQMDMRRRTWWIAYMGMMTSAIVGASRPMIGPDDPRIKTDFPITTLNDTAWPNWIETVKICSRTIDLIIGLDAPQLFASDPTFNSTPGPEDRRRIKRDLVTMDRSVVEWMKQAEASSIIELVPGAEEEVVRNQQLSARLGCAVMHIQIHKRQAFPEVSLFSKKICGFPKAKVISALRGDGQSARLSPATSSMLAHSPRESNSPSHSSPLGQSSIKPSPVLEPTMYGGMDPKTLGFDYNMLNDSAPVDFVFPSGQPGTGDMSAMMDGLLWDSTSYPGTLPQPWFAQPKGAAGLWNPTDVAPPYNSTPVFDSSLLDMSFFYSNNAEGSGQGVDPAWAQQMQGLSLAQPEQAFSADPAFVPPPTSSSSLAQSSSQAQSQTQYNASTVTTISTGRQPITRVAPTHRSVTAPHQAWGVDIVKPPSPVEDSAIEEDDMDDGEIFPPGVSLARCATAAHSVVRLEVLHRSASMALWKGPPKWLPFCACGLVAGAYSFLLLALAVQAENQFSPRSTSKSEEIRALLTNVKVILAGLEAYGVMWDGIGAMATEVRAALEAASTLPDEVEAIEQA